MVSGRFISDERGELYEIEHLEQMPPFLSPIASDTTLWAYFSSVGGVAAGRISPECSLFGYETDDRLHNTNMITGPVTAVRAEGADAWWFPFTRIGSFSSRRSMAKSAACDRIVLTDRSDFLGITARAEWSVSDEHGFIRQMSLTLDEGREPSSLLLIDGFRNLLPPDLPLPLQQSMSTLVDAYKRAELVNGRAAVYALETEIVDSPRPSEATRCAMVWSYGLDSATITLRDEDWYALLAEQKITPTYPVLGQRSAYLLRAPVSLRAGAPLRWGLIADTAINHNELVARLDALQNGTLNEATVGRAVRDSSRRLHAMLARSDSEQRTADRTVDAHHLSNVLFNAMRGGTFAADTIEVMDLRLFLRSWNRRAHAAAGLDALGKTVTRSGLIEHAERTGDPDLIRLAFEYLPLTFSRRHGDPSRPWNHFHIQLRDAAGRRRFGYQGNWRDIFQNWEALCTSFPRWTGNVVAKFVNASTADGFNPYRMSHEGIDWERPEPDEPWADIGYWGDHQIVYLHRLLALLGRIDPRWLSNALDRGIFTYADVPYRLKPYAEIVHDPKHTIEFDHQRDNEINARVKTVGADGRLLHDAAGRIVHVTLAEKLLVPFLAKICNLMPGGGIWMNTQRPEWNDANNALVGDGLSVVTLFHARAYARFCLDLFETAGLESLSLSRRVADWCDGVVRVLIERLPVLEDEDATDSDLRVVLDELGAAFDRYRLALYGSGPGAAETFPVGVVVDMFRLAIRYFDHTIEASKRNDGLYDSYKLLSLDAAGADVAPLQEMLEGQVAAISSGALKPEDVADLVDRLFDSPLFRPDQQSFVLYPVVERRTFLERNRIPDRRIKQSKLLSELVRTGAGGLTVRDAHGDARFGAHLHTAQDVNAALDRLSEHDEWIRLIDNERDDVLDTFEHVFEHQRFTGRSGSMYKYEGIGSIYWHMVSKLLIAIQEATIDAIDRDPGSKTNARLVRSYFRVRSGLCFNKSPSEYGAFPTDPYSHTPAHVGAQQPGTTGQVKEGVLLRFGELGVRLDNGIVAFRPALLRAGEFLTSHETWAPLPDAEPIELPAGTLGFTYAGTPVVYRIVDAEPTIGVTWADNSRQTIDGDELPADFSSELLDRSGQIRLIEVGVPRARLLETMTFTTSDTRSATPAAR